MLLFTSTRHLSLKNTKKLSFVQMSAYSKLNYTYWINNFLSNKCFNEQLPSPKRNADKLYSESFLKFLLEKSYVYNVSNLMGFIQFNQKNKNLITASYNWSDFVKTIRLVNLNNAVIALPIFFNLKNYIFYLHKICFYNYITLILTKNYKLKSFARIAQSRVTFLSYFFYK